jgi:hypothetical protein
MLSDAEWLETVLVRVRAALALHVPNARGQCCECGQDDPCQTVRLFHCGCPERGARWLRHRPDCPVAQRRVPPLGERTAGRP